MHRNHSFLSCATVMCALWSSACATSATNLRPGELAKNQGAVFGHIEVVNQGEEVTSRCYVLLTDEGDHRKAYLSLDKTGWVFTAVDPGTTHLRKFICTLGDLIKYNAIHDTRDLKFYVPGGDKIVYFGHVKVDLNSEGSNVVGATVLFGAIGNALASQGEGENAQVEVVDHFDEAKLDYQGRYGKEAEALKPTVSIAGKAANAGAPPPLPVQSAPARASASAGGPSPASAEPPGR